MERRFVSMWFRHLATDWFSLRQPELKSMPFVLRTSSHGRMVITATNNAAEQFGIQTSMALADARVFVQDLHVLDDKPDLLEKLLPRLAEWCIRFSPVVAIDPPDGLLMDASGCTHLWGGDSLYLDDISKKLTGRGYDVRLAMADTIGVAWGIARFGLEPVVAPGRHIEALLPLPPQALRLSPENIDRLHKLGLKQIRQFFRMPRAALRRRFGTEIIHRLDQAIGQEIEAILPVIPLEPYQERLPCLEPILTLPGIEIALQRLLEGLCLRLRQEQKGIRVAVLKAYRVDGKIEHVQIATSRPSHHVDHLFKLFSLKLSTIEPALGIELFVLDAVKVEDHLSQQEKMWEATGGLDDERLSELIDRLASKLGIDQVHRYVADEHYWPERSYQLASSLHEPSTTTWLEGKSRPIHILATPQVIEVTAPVPDYPPMLFRYKGEIHQVVKADGPERVEQEWWLQNGQHRDYYRVEDQAGRRYWIFRLGHYEDKLYKWFIHGFFA